MQVDWWGYSNPTCCNQISLNFLVIGMLKHFHTRLHRVPPDEIFTTENLMCDVAIMMNHPRTSSTTCKTLFTLNVCICVVSDPRMFITFAGVYDATVGTSIVGLLVSNLSLDSQIPCSITV